MRLDCYKIHEFVPEIVPGNPRRAWMDAFTDRHPYRCLPLTMANSTGWEILCQVGLTMEWDGGPMEENITITADEHWPPVKNVADSHFRKGIVTFHTGHLFKTPPGWGVWVSGPPNEAKDGIAPLTGLVETDWLPFPFTMNWQFTRPGRVRFEKGEPFAFITLMEHHKLEEIQPTLRMLDDNRVLKEEYSAWSLSRGDFLKRLAAGEENAKKERWQRNYMRGQTVTGKEGEGHKTKRRLKAPRKPLPGL
ncbi:MAG: hypothetical protein CME88_11090 [Hirschia sp.]|nr:hypothetical protein [Hirschia sp.]MBF18913.1 hypothetical protein [Hirschia sp.]